MREILFKAKRRDNGAWVEGFFWKDIWGDGESCYIFYDGEDYAVDPSTVCQYTGLTDKNGKKIFEGDKLYDPHENSIYTVDWNGDNATFQMAHDWHRRSMETACYCEIIGSIHDGEGGEHEEG